MSTRTEKSAVPYGMTPNILPGILKTIAEVAGILAALKFCASFRGSILYIPTINRLKEDHRIVDAVGWDAACAIAKSIGGGEVAVPTGRPVLRAYRCRVLRSAGYSSSQIALLLDMCVVHVRRLAPVCGFPVIDVDKEVIDFIFEDVPKRFQGMQPEFGVRSRRKEAAEC